MSKKRPDQRDPAMQSQPNASFHTKNKSKSMNLAELGVVTLRQVPTHSIKQSRRDRALLTTVGGPPRQWAKVHYTLRAGHSVSSRAFKNIPNNSQKKKPMVSISHFGLHHCRVRGARRNYVQIVATNSAWKMCGIVLKVSKLTQKMYPLSSLAWR